MTHRERQCNCEVENKKSEVYFRFSVLYVGAHIGGAVEVAVRLMCAPVVVVEDVGGAFEVGDGAGDFEDAVVGSRRHVHAFHGVTIYSCSSFDWLRIRFSMSSRSLRSSASACWASRCLRLVSKSA